MYRSNLKYSCKRFSTNLIIVALITITINMINIYALKQISSSGIVTVKDYVFYIYKGIRYITPENPFHVPFIWLICNISILGLNIGYMEKELAQNSIYIVSRCGKTKFWFSRVMAAMVNIVLFYLIIFCITWFMASLFYKIENNYKLYVNIFALYVLTSAMMVMISYTLMIFISGRYALIISTILLITSIFSSLKIMPGQHSLIMRHIPYVNTNGLTIMYSVLYNTVIIIVCTFIEGKFIEKKDIY